MDVSRRRLSGFHIALAAIVLIGFVLRLKGIHNPLLDHPGWRQGDTAAIARNFATLDMNPFHPQTDYDGPPPNYVELELQIVPYLAALLYKLFGVHEIFGRLITIGFSLATVAIVGLFGRRLFRSDVAGLGAALLFATYPGSVYYGRTFTPDTTMVFFLTAALAATWQWLEEDPPANGGFARAAALMALALLAKPVAIVGLVPVAALLVSARGLLGTLRSWQTYAFFAAALLPYAGYDAYVRAIAEWHWASGITQKHVVPALVAAFGSLAGFRHHLGLFRDALALVWNTMLGPFGTLAFVLALATPVPARARAFLWAWLAALLAYAFAVVTVERVDYYLYAALPLAALWSGGLVAFALDRVPAAARRRASVAALAVLALAGAGFGRGPVRAYYRYNPAVYRAAKTLDKTLAPDALVVMGHYDPSVLYYIGRKGWEEDPYLWTPFDEQSAIRKGARYFIAVEKRRLARNVELAAWLERFPVLDARAVWPVYETDVALTLPGAEARWRAFRRRERGGR